MTNSSSHTPAGESAGADLPWLWIAGSFIIGLLIGGLGVASFSAGNSSRSETVAQATSENARDDAQDGAEEMSAIGRGASNVETGAGNLEMQPLPSAESGSPEAVMQKLLTTLESGEDIDGLSILARIQQLKDMGDAGLQVIADYLASYQDIEFGDDMGRLGRRFPSLRAMLIDSLEGVDSPIAQAASLQVLQTSPYLSEIAMAARNLEMTWPGEHRDAAVAAMGDLLDDYNQRVASDPTSLEDFDKQREYFMAMRFIAGNNAPELLPKMEEAIQLSGEGAGHYVMQLGMMDSAAQREALNRLMANDQTRSQLAESGWALSRLDMNDPGIQQTTMGVFASDMDAGDRVEFLEGLGRVGRGGRWSMRESSPEERQTQITGAMGMIDALRNAGALQDQEVSTAADEAYSRLTRRSGTAEG